MARETGTPATTNRACASGE